MRSLFFLSLLFIFISCNNPLSRRYNTKTYQQDIGAIRESKKINYEDVELLSKYIVVSQLAGNDMQGKTYEEILDKIKDIRKANVDENDQLKLEQELKRERLGSFITVILSEKNFTTINNKDVMNYTVVFKNTSAKNINTIIGSISLNDLLDRQIKKIDIVVDEIVEKNSTLKKIYTIPYRGADESDKHIRVKSLSDLRVNWNPDKIIFTDGQILQ